MVSENGQSRGRKECGTHVFWGEIAPCDHVVQIYEDDEVFLDTLAGFVCDGINAGDCNIVIATETHLRGLENKLFCQGIDVDELKAEEQYFPLEAEQALTNFMVDGWPDEVLFTQWITGLIEKARSRNRNVRAFGEMVALLWEQGHSGATVHLEHLWNRICKEKLFRLFCAYPKSGFTQDATDSLQNICSAHSKIITTGTSFQSQLLYKSSPIER